MAGESSKLENVGHSAPRKTGADMANTKSVIPFSGDDKSGGVATGGARRPAAAGGSNASLIQGNIGGPYGGATGSAASKAARISALPDYKPFNNEEAGEKGNDGDEDENLQNV